MNIPSVSSVLDAKSDIHLLEKFRYSCCLLLIRPGKMGDDLLDPNCLQTLIAGLRERQRERERERERDCMKLAHKYFVLAAVVS